MKSCALILHSYTVLVHNSQCACLEIRHPQAQGSSLVMDPIPPLPIGEGSENSHSFFGVSLFLGCPAFKLNSSLPFSSSKTPKGHPSLLAISLIRSSLPQAFL